MRTLLILLAGFGVLTLAFWAYRENYATQQALREVKALQREVAALREAIAVNRAEWAYLNRPDRLAELVVANVGELPLFAITPEQFAALSNLPLPSLVPDEGMAAEPGDP
jgi:hypothetical protein